MLLKIITMFRKLREKEKIVPQPQSDPKTQSETSLFIDNSVSGAIVCQIKFQ